MSIVIVSILSLLQLKCMHCLWYARQQQIDLGKLQASYYGPNKYTNSTNFDYPDKFYQWNHEWPYDKDPPIYENDRFDFIIVGAGSAGATLAARLTEDKNYRVLLLEAGKPEMPFLTDVPMACTYLQLTDFTWMYRMARQNNVCLAMKNEQCAWPRGKALGGTSVINYMIYTRGNRFDYDRWEAEGNPGWGYQDVLPYYKRSERARLQFADPQYHNTNGQLNVEDIPYRTPLAYAFLEAGRELGKPTVDYNGRDHFGFSFIQATMRNGKRCSVTKAFLRGASNRPNLRVLPLSHVSKILIFPETNQAYGVEYFHDNKKFTAYALKEVILSAGPFGSPQLLMLSGVGPSRHLNDLGIPLLKDLPVGQLLQDHLTFIGATFLTNAPIGMTFKNAFSGESLKQYLDNSTGPLTSIGGVEGIGYIKTSESKDTIDYPDIELLYASGAVNIDGGTIIKNGINLRDDYYKQAFEDISFKPSFTIIPMLLHPKSRGYMELKSRNPMDYPILHGNYYTDPEGSDVKTMMAAIRYIQRVVKTKPFQRYGSTLYQKPLPGCQHHQFDSDNYWACALQFMTFSLHHQVGTCRMGPASDPTTVVNSKFKVHGISNLRVVDSSVIPFPLSAHTNAPAIMIGERAADFIKDEWFDYDNRI